MADKQKALLQLSDAEIGLITRFSHEPVASGFIDSR